MPASACSRCLRPWSDTAGAVDAKEGPFDAGVDTRAGGAAATAFFVPLDLPASRLSILRTRSSTPNGLNITSSDRTSAARAWTVPLSIPEIRSTGVAPMAGWVRTYWQI